MPLEKTSSFNLPNGEVIGVVWIRLPDGRLVPRRPEELIQRPPLPAPGK